MFKNLLCLSLLAGLASGASAQSSAYSYAYSGAGVSGSGNVYLSGTSTDGVFAVDSISGQVNGNTLAGLLPSGTYNNNDNLFYDGDAYLDANGVSFSLTNGAQVNIFYDGSDYYFQGDGDFQLDGGSAPQPQSASAFSPMDLGDPSTIELDSFTFAPLDTSATPEPKSFALLGTGLAGIAGLVRRRRVVK